MAVDEAYLLGLRTFEDLGGGFREEFLTPSLGGRRAVAVLSRPLERSRAVGWVICHSFALEQLYLSHLEAQAARSLAAEGFPVLRYHGRGYGDSEGLADGVCLTSHLADAKDAVKALVAETGVEQVGMIGGRFGGTVAALAAEAEGLPFVVLWDPMLHGGRFLRDHLLGPVISGLFAREPTRAPGAVAADLMETLQRKGRVDVKGFVLTRQAYDEISGVDLVRDIRPFEGSVLLVALAAGDETASAIDELAGRFRSLGARCAVDTVRDPFAREFGQFHLRASPGTRGKADVRADLDEAIVRSTVRWCVGAVGGEVG
jgi:pimeloyl-ACP methyl ester carboxylesterase